MDPQRRTDTAANRRGATGLAARPATLTSPTRFVPPVLTPPAPPPTRHEIDELLADERERAHQAGLADARAEIDALEAAHHDAIARLDRAAAALGAAADQLHAHDRATLGDFEDHTIALALDLATCAIGRELESMTAPVVDAAKRAAAFVPDRSDTIVRIHPDDAEQVTAADGSSLPALTEALGGRHRVTVVADASIEPGACTVHVGPLRIDTQLGPAVERMREALRS